MAIEKLVLDAAPLLSQTREEILAKSTQLYTTPAVYGEIKDESARQRLELIKDHLTVQQPTPQAVAFVTEFAKKTGDFDVLSTPDIGIIALTYDLYPDQQSLHSSPQLFDASMQIVEKKHHRPQKQQEEQKPDPMADDGFTVVANAPKRRGKKYTQHSEQRATKSVPEPVADPVPEPIADLVPEPVADPTAEPRQNDDQEEDSQEESDDDNEDDWITPENVVEKVQKDSTDLAPVTATDSFPVALASNDFAVQNVTLQIGLEAIGSTGMRIKQLKSFMQRCHACFKLLPLAKDGPPRQFCPRCGGHTLTRVTVSVKDGKLHLHLKGNMQWKTRGDRYTMASPQSQRARRERHDPKVEFYAEDQPEYQKAVKTNNWERRRNQRVTDAWIGPGTVESPDSPFVAGRRQVGKIRIGRGRNANAK